MKKAKKGNLQRNEPLGDGFGRFVPLIILMAALCAAFLLGRADLGLWTKAALFVGTVLVSGFLTWHFSGPNVAAFSGEKPADARIGKDGSDGGDGIFDSEVENKLLALEEAREFFGASLNSSDMFRLVATRINEMLPFETGVLYLLDEKRINLNISHAVGKNSEIFKGLKIPASKGLAGKVFVGRRGQIDKGLAVDRRALSSKATEGLSAAVAAPLFRDSEVFAVLELFGKTERDFDSHSVKLLEAIGERFAPLFLSSREFERSLSNALTDPQTNLPNERAFYLVLENQIAQSQRLRDERSLSLLAFDIKSFAEINEKFGHSVGNEILVFTAEQIKNGLRRMDFLARSSADEFLAVLPTASEEIAEEVIGRLERSFEETPFQVPGGEKILVRLNFGAATFLKDGETPDQLLKTANLRKHQSKAANRMKVVWFPKNKDPKN
ncbi:MAG: sensor domain-containing diguanylate cyclase [Pyrinomonadaceae bacterium]